MKKFLTILLVLCLALTGLSAGSFRVGGELGWGFDFYKVKYSYEGEAILDILMKNNGFALNLVGEYDFTESWGLKASVGMMFARKAKGEIDISANTAEWGDDISTGEMTAGERSGVYFDFAVAGKYNININDKFSISPIVGVEMLLGNVYYENGLSDDEKKDIRNFAFGANIGVEVSYMIIENLRINAGVTGAWFFVNTCDPMNYWNYEAAGIKKTANSFYVRPYVGVTYAF